jgi:Tfp pilus assembly protein PilZ
MTVLKCCRMKQYVFFKTDKKYKINPEVVLVVTVLLD